MIIRAYLRASTTEQDANRARDTLREFAASYGHNVTSWYVENVSGASLQRPELTRLLDDASTGDVLLIEQVDRLSRLDDDDWSALKSAISERGVIIVAMDLPTSYRALVANQSLDDVTTRIMQAMNAMMLDVLAAMARKDYADRRRRQAQGIAKAKAAGKYRGRPINQAKHNAIKELAATQSLSIAAIARLTNVSRMTVYRVLNNIQ